MTCHPFIDAATAALMTPNAERAQLSAMGHHMDTTALPSGPAATTGMQPTLGINERIASRCNRLSHSNNEQRKRYLSLHRTLSNPSGGDA